MMLTCGLPFRLFIQAALEQRIGVLVHLVLAENLNEFLSVVVAEQFLSGYQWLFFLELFTNTCNGAHQVVALQ